MRTLAMGGIWFALLVLAACVAWALLRIPALRAHVVEVEAGRMPGLDGLRALLALSVFVHHAYLTRHAALFGSWGAPDNAFVQVLGLGPVAVFFMITAYLFWSRAIARLGRIAALAFYGSRLRRIYPAFAGSIALLLLVAAVEAHLHLRESAWTVAGEVARQLSLGIATGSTVNGNPHAYLIDAGVTWSLGFEAAFYLALPLLALTVPRGRSPIAMLAVAAVAAVFARHCWIVVCFIPGMVAAQLATSPRFANAVAMHASKIALGGCALLAAAVAIAPRSLLTLARGPQFDVLPQLLALCAIFFGVVFSARPTFLYRLELRFLGSISFSVYLLHAIVLYVATHLVAQRLLISAMSSATYWLFIAACVPFVVAVATFSYFTLEVPFMGNHRVSHVRGQSVRVTF